VEVLRREIQSLKDQLGRVKPESTPKRPLSAVSSSGKIKVKELKLPDGIPADPKIESVAKAALKTWVEAREARESAEPIFSALEKLIASKRLAEYLKAVNCDSKGIVPTSQGSLAAFKRQLEVVNGRLGSDSSLSEQVYSDFYLSVPDTDKKKLRALRSVLISCWGESFVAFPHFEDAYQKRTCRAHLRAKSSEASRKLAQLKLEYEVRRRAVEETVTKAVKQVAGFYPDLVPDLRGTEELIEAFLAEDSDVPSKSLKPSRKKLPVVKEESAAQLVDTFLASSISSQIEEAGEGSIGEKESESGSEKAESDPVSLTTCQ